MGIRSRSSFKGLVCLLGLSLLVGCPDAASTNQDSQESADTESVADTETPDGPDTWVFPGQKDASLPDSQELAPDAPDAVEPDGADGQVTALPPVIISEIMKDPEGVEDSSGEWIELSNVGEEVVDLEGWVLQDSNTNAHTIVGSLPIEPGSAIVLGPSDAWDENGNVPVNYVYPYEEFILANGSDQVVLSWNGVVVDEVQYGTVEDGWPAGNGRSLSLNPDAYGPSLNDAAQSWCDAPLLFQAVEPSSPGLVNPSCDAVPEADCTNGLDDDEDGKTDCDDEDCAGELLCSAIQPASLVIAEVMSNPSALTDAEGEWFELVNVSDLTMDLRGLRVGAGGGDGHEMTADEPLEVAPGGRMVLAASAAAAGGSVDYVWGAGFGTLKNSDGAIVLVFNGLEIDRVEWNGDAGFPLEAGVSMSLSADAETAQDNDGAFSWCLAVSEIEGGGGDFGTPGADNPVCPEPPLCGNGELDEGEECDDGNPTAGDGCEADCTLTPPECGDGIVDEGETCDDANQESGDGCSSVCTDEVPVPVGAVVITELLTNPVEVSDQDGEWLELYNMTAEAIDLKGWQVLDGDGLAFVIAPTLELLIQPGAYMVLGRNGDLATNGDVQVDYEYGNSLTLANSGGTVALSWAGVVVDQLVYAIPPFPEAVGTSLQLDEASYSFEANDLSENWCTSEISIGLWATPGEPNGSCVTPVGTCGDGEVQDWEVCDDGNTASGDGCEENCIPTPVVCGNSLTQEGEECDDGNAVAGDGCEPDCTWTPSVCGDGTQEPDEACDDGNLDDGDGCQSDCTLTPISVGDVVITELMKDPVAVADSKGEWFEVQNVSSMTIDMEGWTLGELEVEAHVVEESVVLAPQELALFCRSNVDENGGLVADYVYVGVSLKNGADELALVAPSGVVVDVVAYDDGDTFPDESGASLQLDESKHDAVANDIGENWCVSSVPSVTGDLGTPGLPNASCFIPDTCGDETCQPEEGESCANCSQDCGVCDPCSVDLGAGCGGCDVEACVCDADPSCCEVAWTTTCAHLSSSVCGGDLCPYTGCNPVEVAGASGTVCEDCVCELQPSCCDVLWDEECAQLCGSTCGQDCGSSGCDSSALPGCDDCGCEECVCSLNPECCTEGWGPECVAACDLCGGNCLSDGCGVSELAACNACECKNCVCGDDPLCCDVAWDASCVSACVECGQDCGSDGCEVSAFPGCDGCACEADVCALSPSCCDVVWDFNCAVLCIGAGQDCGNAGCEPAPEPGCDGCLCEECVCEQDPSCCEEGGSWTIECAALCKGCGQPCPQDGCSASAFAGCDGCSCETCVCEADASCCDVAWDGECAALCQSCGSDCGFACGNGIIEPGEVCDNGTSNSDIEPDACRLTCVLPSCGDGVQDESETCDDGNTDPGDGCDVDCAVEAAVPGAGDLVITEVMYNPTGVVDSQGEWFEVWNASGVSVSLADVVIAINDVSWSPEATVVLAPQGYLVVGANADSGSNGGLAVDVVFGDGAELANTGQTLLSLTHEATVLDSFTYDVSTFPLANGASLTLDLQQLTSVANDSVDSWCLASSLYGEMGNYGTPGAENDPCPFCGDGSCEDGEGCETCSTDCGECGSGCAVSASSGCGGCACEACVCSVLPGCCTGSWTADCVEACGLCGGCVGE